MKEAKEVSEGLLVDFDESGNVVGIDIDNAAKKLDLKSLETNALPIATTKIA